jgi:hypothetical protein
MVRLDDDVTAALERLMAERADLKTPGAAASYLLRDALIGLGLLPLGSNDRGAGAKRGGA